MEVKSILLIIHAKNIIYIQYILVIYFEDKYLVSIIS